MSHDPVDAQRESLAARTDEWMESTFAVVQRFLIGAVAIVLTVLSVMALWDTVILVHQQLQANNMSEAISTGVDTVFLTVILLELMHTVITRGSLAVQAQEFIIIGITSAIRHGLGLVASSTSSVHAPNPRDTVINLALNSLTVLVLVAALWLVRSRFQGTGAEEEDERVHTNV